MVLATSYANIVPKKVAEQFSHTEELLKGKTEDKILFYAAETTFKLYDVPSEKIQETIEFVSQIDFKQIANELIKKMLEKVAEKA